LEAFVGLLGAVAFCGLLLSLFAFGDCRHVDQLVEVGAGVDTDRSELCGSLPLGSAWWFVQALAPLMLTLLAGAASRRRIVPTVPVAALAVATVAAFVVVLHGQSTSP